MKFELINPVVMRSDCGNYELSKMEGLPTLDGEETWIYSAWYAPTMTYLPSGPRKQDAMGAIHAHKFWLSVERRS